MKLIKVSVASFFAAAALVAGPASVAQAAATSTDPVVLDQAEVQRDPCGASSWLYSGGQVVGYRNCGSSTINIGSTINNFRFPCQSIAGGSSGVIGAYYPASRLLPWSTYWC